MLQSPFWWMRPHKKGMTTALVPEMDSEIEDGGDFGQIKRAVGTVHQNEMVYAAVVERVADNLTQRTLGYSSTPWLTVLNVATIIHTFLTMLACFKKPDFVNLTIVVILFYSRYFY